MDNSMWMFLQRFCVRGGVGRLGGEGQGGREDQKANTKILWNTNQYIYIYMRWVQVIFGVTLQKLHFF